jgi:hypothetical protein
MSLFNLHVQDLRDSDRERKANYFNKRGWFETWRWQLVISKHPFKLYGLLKLTLKLVPQSYNFAGFTVGLLGVTFYYTRERYDNTHPLNYGFYTYDDSFVFEWANSFQGDSGYYKSFYYPWAYDYCQTEYINTSGNWVIAKSWQHENKKTEVFDYTYVLKNGTIQNRKATVSVERRTWWQRWFGLGKKHLTPKKVRTSINVQFDGEVGERTGSWKGGTIGCGYDLLPGETPEQCLRRMETEREF